MESQRQVIVSQLCTWFISFHTLSSEFLFVNLTATSFPSLISLTNFVSLPSHFCTCTSVSPSMVKIDCKHQHLHLNHLQTDTRRRLHTNCWLTLTCRSSAVVSSNSSPSLEEISVFLKVLWVLTTTLSPSWLIATVGLVTLPTCLVAKPTPVNK